MNKRIDFITEIIERIPDITMVKGFVDCDGKIAGNVKVLIPEVELEFVVEIYLPYPFQFHETESIRFINRELIEFNHVNRDGSICIHTSHSPDLAEKLMWDFESLKDWIRNYYLLRNADAHYEHIIVGEYQGDELSTFLFTDVNHRFSKNSYGHFVYSFLAEGNTSQKKRQTFLIQGFLEGKNFLSCDWSNFYKNSQDEFLNGLYVYIEKPPVKNRRFAVDSWAELRSFVSQEFLKFLHNLEKNGHFKKKGIPKIPLLIGYSIPNDEVHWQCVMIDGNNFPNESVKLKNGWGGILKDMPIHWSSTKNCTYKYFFGRGKFSEKITDKKILIIGVGAVGSIVATTLTRGGCKYLSLVDYDVKEPENVCRSEYDFSTGIIDKVLDLGIKLSRISPFVEIIPDSNTMDVLKYYIHNREIRNDIKNAIEKYDIIIDCTTDDDVAYILDKLDLKNEVISFSITNNANELLCSVKPNLYDWLKNRDAFIQKNDLPLYEPTGCWNPTFKASFNDINTLVQFALKHINITIENGNPLRHFFLSTELENGFNIKLNQF